MKIALMALLRRISECPKPSDECLDFSIRNIWFLLGQVNMSIDTSATDNNSRQSSEKNEWS